MGILISVLTTAMDLAAGAWVLAVSVPTWVGADSMIPGTWDMAGAVLAGAATIHTWDGAATTPVSDGAVVTDTSPIMVAVEDITMGAIIMENKIIPEEAAVLMLLNMA